MPVCLHCGELNPDGSLFCQKCGFTLPQTAAVAPPPPPPPPPPPTATSAPAPVRSVPPPPPSYWQPAYAPGAAASYAIPAGATPPMPPPPSGKFCLRCRTVISQSAVYCPVCQQPQVP